MAHRKRWCWRWRRSIFSFVFVCTCWTMVGRWALCKPMAQDQGPATTGPQGRWPNSAEAWTMAEQESESDVQSSDTIARLDQLRKTMETFKRLRLMLNERLLTSGAAKTRENFKYSGASPSAQADAESDVEEEPNENRRRNIVLVASMDELDDTSGRHYVLKRADPENDSPLPVKPRHRNQKDRQQQRRHRQRMRMLSRNQRKLEERRDAELEHAMQDDGAAFQNQIQGLQVTANLQQSMDSQSAESVRTESRRRQDDFRLLAGLAKSDYECPKLHGKATQVLCPSRRRGYRVCIPDTALCNGHVDCPLAEDEDPVNCLFYKTTIHHFRLIVDAVVELSDVVKKHENRHSLDEL